MPAVTADDDVRNELWIERAAEFVGLEALARERLDRPWLAPYLLFGFVYLVDYGLLAALQYRGQGFHPFLANPSIVLLPVGMAFAIWAARRLRDAYEDTVEGLIENGGDERFGRPPGPLARSVLRLDGTRTVGGVEGTTLRKLVSDRLKVVLLLLGWGFHASWIVFTPDALAFIFDVQGPVGAIRFFGTIPFVYYVIVVDFAAVYVGILLLLPYKVRTIGIINFQDPLAYGHLKPIGDLTKAGTKLYLFAVAAYVLFTGFSAYFAGADASLPGPVPVGLLGVSAAIVVGVALFVHPVIVVHGHMKNAKHEKIQELAREVEASGPREDEMMFPETSVPETPDDGHEYVQYFIKMTRVENTHEYPIDVSHLQELVLAALVPFVAHVTVTVLFSYVGNGGGH